MHKNLQASQQEKTRVANQYANDGVIISLRRRLRILEVWFDDFPSSVTGYDLLVCHQRSQPFSKARWLYFYTVLVDLTRTETNLLGEMSKGTIYEIKRARDRDELTCYFSLPPTTENINEFISYYEINTQLPDKVLGFRESLMQLQHAGLLGLSRACSVDGKNIVWHAYVCHERQQRARLLHSISFQQTEADPAIRNMIGRANRYLHYSDMLFLKEHHYQLYDFGGWYAGIEDEKRLNINNFKEGFGGQVVFGFDCEEPLTFRGWAYLIGRSVWRRLFDPTSVNDNRRRRAKALHAPKS